MFEEPTYCQIVGDLLKSLLDERLRRDGSREEYDRHLSIAITETEKLQAYLEFHLYGEW